MNKPEYKNRGEQNSTVNHSLQPSTVTVADLMNIRRKAMTLTAEIDKLLGIGNKKASKPSPYPDQPGYKRERSS
jgi:hypothetical protein